MWCVGKSDNAKQKGQLSDSKEWWDDRCREIGWFAYWRTVVRWLVCEVRKYCQKVQNLDDKEQAELRAQGQNLEELRFNQMHF